jgi:hypothetical protein
VVRLHPEVGGGRLAVDVGQLAVAACLELECRRPEEVGLDDGREA